MKTIIVLSLMTMVLNAWDGYDYNTGSYVEIGEGNLVRT
jgi:hypothetical protein